MGELGASGDVALQSGLDVAALELPHSTATYRFACAPLGRLSCVRLHRYETHPHHIKTSARLRQNAPPVEMFRSCANLVAVPDPLVDHWQQQIIKVLQVSRLR